MNRFLAFCIVSAGAACAPGPAQSQDCKDYLNCVEKTEGAQGRVNPEGLYGQNGTCWTTTTVAADACTSSCKKATASLKSSYPDAGCK